MLEWLTIIAIFVGPTVAIQIQQYLGNNKDIKKNKTDVFKTLMTTRNNKLSFEHVKALNMIDIEFYGDNKVIEAWKLYRDHLNLPSNADPSWMIKAEDYLTDLLYEMGQKVGQYFDKISLKRGFYSPNGHVVFEDQQILARKLILEVLNRILSEENPLKLRLIESQKKEDEKEKAS